MRVRNESHATKGLGPSPSLLRDVTMQWKEMIGLGAGGTTMYEVISWLGHGGCIGKSVDGTWFWSLALGFSLELDLVFESG